MRDHAELSKSVHCCVDCQCEICPRGDTPFGYIECKRKLADDTADAIEELLFERDRYKSFFDRIKDLPDCNICLKKNGCEFVPRPGEHTRINCAFCLTAPPKEEADND